ncbi:DNA-binding transcriptional regulator GadX [Vibrio aerogenes CECT 7868]|uniref:DNA-binding transcriptional regulator GadX n=1 Tax=Vibrio aerogenes CECT 7868 TaxID=1216006 RepID=A0A1M5ZA21_9VIBR|nr:AraC family transcriptional regulator [Vibrio aerogenes]SHI21085.1 DNA-binding transcriptional regulator GadX [Vibrio aerogenes CECT 7868]
MTSNTGQQRRAERDQKLIPAEHHLALLLDLVKERGLNLHYVLRRTGIFYEDLFSGELKISPRQFARLVFNLSQLENEPSLSFVFGQRLFPGSLGTSAHLLTHAPTLRALLDNLCQYVLTFFPLLQLRIRETESRCYLLVEDPFGESFALSDKSKTAYLRWLTESLFTAIISFTRWRLGCALPWQAVVHWKAPDWQAQYQMYWGEAIQYAQQITALSLPSQWLDRPLPDSSPTLYALAQSQMPPPATGMLSWIRQQFRAAPATPPSLEALARQTETSPATLKRHLKAHHASYRVLLDEVRQQQAVYLRSVYGFDDERIASELKFFDVSNFRRALRRWAAG